MATTKTRLKNKVTRLKNELLEIKERDLQFESLDLDIQRHLFRAIDELRSLYDNI